MSACPQPQTQANTQVHSAQGPAREHHSPTPVPKPIIPSKRSDDDIQFISSQPVKRRRISEHNPTTMPTQQMNAPMPIIPIPPVAFLPTELRDSDRRISTGMVGLPSDFNAMELTSVLRGVSLPVLEKFVLNQPLRKPRPPSPPELSPKQLPRTVTPGMLNSSANENGPEVSGFHVAPVACMTASEGPPAVEMPAQNQPNASLAADHSHVFITPVTHVHSPSPVLAETPRDTGPNSSSMPPPPLPRAEIPMSPESTRSSPTLSKTATHNATRPDTVKQPPCHICTRMRQQANFAKAQGFPMLPHGMPHHMVPQMACHPPFGQHLHPQMMAMGPNNMHAFSSGFAPIMMSMNSNNYPSFPPHMPSPAQMDQQGNEAVPQPSPEKPSDQPQPLPATATAATDNSSPTLSHPVKPPASLIQPTYRKPSPNLIVDVAETCQEKFPFEEVAKRHNVPVEKVFDVFAAIIQVPLLRCPTDRRRAGRLATTRVKEYTRAKRAIQESSGQGTSSDPKEEIIVRPLDVADRLGQVELPEGFSHGEP
ncbi:hypothetical protein GGR54DRAFT_602160 [Hypoxylon sp. NC1633]|nr:hypothetical protein GGR54DRAFT_602160 [Hypoxylon sp. NC1633]